MAEEAMKSREADPPPAVARRNEEGTWALAPRSGEQKFSPTKKPRNTTREAEAAQPRHMVPSMVPLRETLDVGMTGIWVDGF